MAIITISRQFGSKGDEIAKVLSEKLGYRIVDRKVLRKKILELGCSEEQMKKFDGLKPGFFASFSKSKDEYLYYLKTAIISEAANGNCIFVGRGAFLVLKDIESCVSFRIFEDRENRIKNLMKNDSELDEKLALKVIKKADWNQLGFHKSFFGATVHDYFLYDLLVNSGNSDVNSIVDSLIAFTKSKITSEKESNGQFQLDKLNFSQIIVNLLVFTYGISIDNFRASVEGQTIIFEGIASTQAEVDNAIKFLSLELPNYEIKSNVRVVQDIR